jgi:hypothetical protein
VNDLSNLRRLATQPGNGPKNPHSNQMAFNFAELQQLIGAFGRNQIGFRAKLIAE